MSTARNDGLTLQALVENIEKAADDFTALLLQVEAHRAAIAKERIALGEIRERLIRLREPIRGWEHALWERMWRNEGNRAAYRKAEAVARMLNTKIGDLVWDLFDFRKDRQS